MKSGLLMLLAGALMLVISGCSVKEMAYSKDDGSKKSNTKYYQYECKGSGCNKKSEALPKFMKESCSGVISTRQATYGYEKGCY